MFFYFFGRGMRVEWVYYKSTHFQFLKMEGYQNQESQMDHIFSRIVFLGISGDWIRHIQKR